MKKIFFFISFMTFIILSAMSQPATRVLIFSKTNGYRHASIEPGKVAIAKLCRENNILCDSTEDATKFNDENLSRYNVLIFLNTTGDLFNNDQKAALVRYIHSGGGWIGIHAATDAEYNWPWYGKLAGAWFKSHPAQQEAIVKVTDRSNPSTSMLPSEWKRFDEWYNFKDVEPGLKILAYLDETSYKGGEMNGDHPIIWYHDFEGGRAVYTGFGHTDETFQDPLFLAHLLGAIQFVTSAKK